jgi:phage shock protein A
MHDSKIIAQIFEDMRQHSSGESLLRAQLENRIGELEGELSTWGEQAFKTDSRIRALKYQIAEYRKALQQIAQPPDSAGGYTLSRADCETLAKIALQQGESYEKETQANQQDRA